MCSFVFSREMPKIHPCTHLWYEAWHDLQMLMRFFEAENLPWPSLLKDLKGLNLGLNLSEDDLVVNNFGDFRVAETQIIRTKLGRFALLPPLRGQNNNFGYLHTFTK